MKENALIASKKETSLVIYYMCTIFYNNNWNQPQFIGNSRIFLGLERYIEDLQEVLEHINWIYIISYGKIRFGLRTLRFTDNLTERITYVNRGSTV